jgi:hypothetical protein
MKFIRFSLLILAGSLLLNSCIKKEYEVPPSTAQYDPNLPVNTSIRTLSDIGLNMEPGNWRKLGDTIISGVVVSNDQSSNFYKQIIIEDTSMAGIILYLDKTYLYSDFPVGRKLYVKLNGLSLINYKGLPEIVLSVDSLGNTTGIPSGMINDYVVKASYPNIVTPLDVTIIDIKSNPNKYINTLIKLNNVQFNSASSNQLYAQPSSMSSGTSRTVEDCMHTATVVMYNSAYSNFQAKKTPSGNGSVTCICSQYYSNMQLLIRDTTDVAFVNPRCP